VNNPVLPGFGQTADPTSLEPPPPSYAGRTRHTLLEFEAILANATLGIAFTRERAFFLCNPKFAEMLGYAPDELIGQPGEVVYASNESYGALGRIAVPILQSGRQLDVEWEFRRKDGSTFIARVIARAISEKNTQQGTVWIVEDISERRRHADEAARLLREQEAILGTTSVGVVFVKDCRIVRCNRRYEQMYGYEPGEIDGQPTRLLYPDEAEYDAAQSGYANFARGQAARRVGQRRRKDGSTFWVRADGRAVDPQNPQRGAVWTVEDVTEQLRAEEELQRVLAEQQALIDNVSVGIAFRRHRKTVRCNRRYEEMFGYAPGEAVGASTRDIYFTEEEFRQAARVYQELDRGLTHAREQWLRRKDGTGFWCRINGRAVQPGDPDKGYVWLITDITQERAAEERVQRALAEQELILDNASVGIAFVRNRFIQRCNRFLEDMVGAGPGELVGQSSAIFFPSEKEWEEAGVRAYSRTPPGGTYENETPFRRRDGTTFVCRARGRRTDAGDAEQEWIWSYEDVTAEHQARELAAASREQLERAVAERTVELQEANARAQHLADHDALTGLPNRRLLEDRLKQALALSYRNRKQTAVMFVDLDRFKTVNDSLGHAVGDVLLKEVAKRLVKQLRVGDTICRIGGDEFMVVLPEVKRSSHVAQVAQKIIEQLSQPVVVEERELTVTPSIGIAVFPDDGRDTETLIRNADAAMYHAKEMGRANYQFFTEQMNLLAARRLALEGDLRRSLGRDEMRLHYQPIVDTVTGKVVAHEALLRWQHPVRGLLAPDEFIQAAEETGLILKIGEWVLREACMWATFIGIERGFLINVNLSARQFNDPKLPQLVSAALRESGLPAELLELEITESTAMQQTDLTLSTLKKLKDLGVSIAIDDFGTGYSSLAYLKRFPVDKLKIDRSFVADVTKMKEQRAIVEAIVVLAHALGLKVIAEGVENDAQRKFLLGCGCEYIQGFATGKPADADRAADQYL
jgi:diguanylate cyclase (GGDEF)-like protein/PAS domain S-box-containing protein